MYKKGVAVEIQFSPARLNDGAGDPYWIDLTREEVQALLQTLQSQLEGGTTAPVVFSVDCSGSDALEWHNAGQASLPVSTSTEVPSSDFKQWVCVICGWIYDESAGLLEEGIAPGTRWADVPEDWRCPLCDVGKEDSCMTYQPFRPRMPGENHPSGAPPCEGRARRCDTSPESGRPTAKVSDTSNQRSRKQTLLNSKPLSDGVRGPFANVIHNGCRTLCIPLLSKLESVLSQWIIFKIGELLLFAP